MEPTVRCARTQPGLATALVQDPANLRQRTRNTASTALGLRAQSRPPGTEFLDAETRRQKWSFKRANARRDQKPRIEWPEIPAKTPYLGSSQECSVCKGWVVGAPGTWDPMIKSYLDYYNRRDLTTGMGSKAELTSHRYFNNLCR